MNSDKPAFQQEFCERHGEPIEATLTFNPVCGTFRWRCPKCGIGWVTEGSAMDVANEIAFANCAS